jgi:hypothetical protein
MADVSSDADQNPKQRIAQISESPSADQRSILDISSFAARNRVISPMTTLDSETVVFVATKSQAAQLRLIIDGLQKLPVEKLEGLKAEELPFWNKNIKYATTPERLYDLYVNETGQAIAGPAMAIATGEIRFYDHAGGATIPSDSYLEELTQKGVMVHTVDRRQIEELSIHIGSACVEQKLSELRHVTPRDLTPEHFAELRPYRKTKDQLQRIEALKLERTKFLDHSPSRIDTNELISFQKSLLAIATGETLMDSLVQDRCREMQQAENLHQIHQPQSLFMKMVASPPECCRCGRQEWLTFDALEPYPLFSDKLLKQTWKQFEGEVRSAMIEAGVIDREMLAMESLFWFLKRDPSRDWGALKTRLPSVARSVYQVLRERGYTHSDLTARDYAPSE